MQSRKDVTREICKIVQDHIDAGLLVRVEWLTTEIIAMKDKIEGDDADFYVTCGIDFIKTTVKHVIGGYAPKPKTDQQLIMDGFYHLQKAYTVERDGEITLVPVTMLGDSELKARAIEYETMSKGCLAHAMEIRSFIYQRAEVDLKQRGQA
ncbi:MAG: hypothetical protein GY832_35140 [Chloroflexi bacterium]|nr:hypothetical protein [Chloroflexota bacterium]